MLELMRRLAAHGDGLLRRSVALDAGLTDDDLARAVRSGVLVRVRRGYYALAEAWHALTPAGRHVLTARAVILALGVPAVAADVTAAVLLGIDVWGVDLATVHVARGDLRSPRREAGVHHHADRLEDSTVVGVGGIPVLGAAEAVVGIAQRHGFEAGVVSADCALRLGLTTAEALRETHLDQRNHRGARAAGRAVAFADGRAESVGESRSRVLFDEGGLPEPQLQVPIHDGAELVARADFLMERERYVIEFDGKLKYRRDRDPVDPPLKDPGEVVWAEKLREDRIRDAGFAVGRLVWNDLSGQANRRRTVERFADRLRRRGWRPRRTA